MGHYFCAFVSMPLFSLSAFDDDDGDGDKTGPVNVLAE